MPMLDKSIKLRPNKCHPGCNIGDQVYGAAGGSKHTPPVIHAQVLADGVAAELGITCAEASRMLHAVGRVAQRLLLRGTPVGIPHVCVVYLMEYRRVMRAATSAQFHSDLYPDGVGAVDRKTTIRKLSMRVPVGIKQLMADNAIYTGDFNQHTARALIENRQRAARKDGRPQYRKSYDQPSEQPQQPAQ